MNIRCLLSLLNIAARQHLYLRQLCKHVLKHCNASNTSTFIHTLLINKPAYFVCREGPKWPIRIADIILQKTIRSFIRKWPCRCKHLHRNNAYYPLYILRQHVETFPDNPHNITISPPTALKKNRWSWKK